MGCFLAFPKGCWHVRLLLWRLWLAHPGLHAFFPPNDVFRTCLVERHHSHISSLWNMTLGLALLL